MKLDVVLPVHNFSSFTDRLLSDIERNTKQPNKIILIDNASTDDTEQICKKYSINIDYIKQPTNIGVNPAWNLGWSRSDADLLSILNNDLNLNSHFFEKILDTFDRYPKCGLALPNTSGHTHEMPTNNVVETNVMQGWAFTIRKSIYDKAGPIPEELRIFFGDNFLFDHTLLQGYKWLKMIDNHIVHLLSQTVNRLRVGPLQHKEEIFWKRIRENMITEKVITHWSQLPANIDMSPYASFYKAHVNMAVKSMKRVLAVELGCRYGCSARIILEELEKKDKFKFILVDPVTTPELDEIIDGEKVCLWMDMCENVVNNFVDESINVLHIDVDPHEYEQTKNIFNLYKDKIAPQGLILFHDCHPNFGVFKFVSDHLEKDPQFTVIYANMKSECPISRPAAVYKEF